MIPLPRQRPTRLPRDFAFEQKKKKKYRGSKKGTEPKALLTLEKCLGQIPTGREAGDYSDFKATDRYDGSASSSYKGLRKIDGTEKKNRLLAVIFGFFFPSARRDSVRTWP